MLLVYISADGLRPDDPPSADVKAPESEQPIATAKRPSIQQSRINGGLRAGGGVALSESAPSGNGRSEGAAATSVSHCLFPEDLLPFTRKKLFLIIESDNSAAFKVGTSRTPALCSEWTHRAVLLLQTMESGFGQPFLCLLSPTSTAPLPNKGTLRFTSCCVPNMSADPHPRAQQATCSRSSFTTRWQVSA